MKNKIIGVIPARYKSSRFPGKPLALLLGKPMIIWVAELTSEALGSENVVVATDDNRIVEVVNEYGYNFILTDETHLTGTDRLAEVAKKIEADIYINIQGDEPTLNPESIKRVAETKQKYPDFVINAMTTLAKTEDPVNVNIPKVVFNKDLKLVYMSRLPIPGYKDNKNKPAEYYKQVCIYAFSRDELLQYGKMERKGSLEKYEDIEILRFFDLNIPIRMIEVEGNSYAVDVKEDVELVENRLKEIHNL